ncbi:NPL4-domain-containing protein [Fistulina hepatica ATCC 64428]|uniref:Nuclear protein localization protein 4 n=1 Tax=Fistulina hepatica ATCC 64428 TaxID=1128425 RepID=A0A0D7AHV1_9AGAR|nr:NPL4-domain-containing protein [Fistulina hepatica ATCC 64428]
MELSGRPQAGDSLPHGRTAWADDGEPAATWPPAVLCGDHVAKPPEAARLLELLVQTLPYAASSIEAENWSRGVGENASTVTLIMLIRIRSKDGNFRFDFTQTAVLSDLVKKITETTVDADISSLTISNQPRGNETLVSQIRDQPLVKLGLKHGDLIFVGYKEKRSDSQNTEISSPTTTTTPAKAQNAWDTVKEDPVDVYWRSQDGKIPRSRDPHFCKHGAKGMCDYCMPLEPYDLAYHTEHSIKHMSFHAYLRKLTPKLSSSLPPLSPLDFKVKSPCPSASHPPWPAGVCTACQPSAITLASQPFRAVDHLEIASMDIIDRFLHAWRKTGSQRFGWMIGRYEPYDEVPMGVKAVVEAICEPPQEGELDGLTLGLPWEDEPRIRALSKHTSIPLTIVGYVFTDLQASEEDQTQTLYKRHPQSFYLSSLEALFAARMQLANPMISRASSTGTFGSRLVTAVLTGTEDGQVDVSAYQMSEQACAMVDADMIEASVEPNIVRIKTDDREAARYVPDVFFAYKNEYGLEVKKSAKPCFPVEYLLVNVTHGFPQTPSPMFRSTQFSIENRLGLEEQSIEGVLASLARLDAPNVTNDGGSTKWRNLATFLSDWHLLVFLETTQLVSMDDMKLMMRTLSAPDLLDNPASLDPILTSESWQTLMSFARETTVQRSSSAPFGGNSHVDDEVPQEVLDQIAAVEAASGGASGTSVRVCPHCTFENSHGGSDCEVCGLPL